MPTLRQIRKRIQSVKNTQQITKAMYMVSAAKLRRAQEGAEQARAYAQALDSVIQNLMGRIEKRTHPLLQEREVKKAEIVFFASDRGLCGGFNSNLIRTCEHFLKDPENKARFEEISLYTVGKKGRDYFRKRKYNVRKFHLDLVRNIGLKSAGTISDELVQNYRDGLVDVVYMIYPVFRSAMIQRPTLVTLLPFPAKELEKGQILIDYIYEPDPEALLSALLPRQIKVQVYRAMLETVASEHAARMTAMDSASTNATDMISSLTLKYNRARQAAITKELMEIIGGAEALEK